MIRKTIPVFCDCRIYILLCRCGCGRFVKPGKKFILGHHAKVNHPMSGKHCSAEAKHKMSLKNKGKNVGISSPRFVHGLSKHPFYITYYDMLYRCYKHDHPNYRWYGARGIKVCAEWLNENGVITFITYLETVLGPKPTSSHSLDRHNNNGNYEPGNLRWATKREQNLNRRVSKK